MGDKLITADGKVVIVTAPSGAGKTTLVHHLLNKFPHLEFSVSACNRSQRPGEVHGKDYYFITTDEFLERVRNEEFVEFEEVYPNTYYGTLKSELDRIWTKGHCALFDVDVRGGLALKVKYADQALALFVKPPSLEALYERLLKRNTETADKIRMRMEKAAYEMEYESRFDRIIVNDTLQHAKDAAEEAVRSFLNENKSTT